MKIEQFMPDTKVKQLLDNIYSGFKYDKIRPSLKLPCKILLFDDCHIPFMNYEIFNEMIHNESDADYWATAELVNLDTFAFYLRKQPADAKLESEKATELLEYMGRKFKMGFVCDSNHTLRIRKFLQNRIDPEQMIQLAGIFGDFKLPYTKMVDHVKIIGTNMVQLGKAVFSHQDSYSSIPLRTVDWVKNNLDSHYDVYNMIEYDSLWSGHTHNWTIGFNGKTLIAELGCMGYIQPYVLDKKPKARNNRWINGYGVLVLDKNGNTDYKNSRIQYLGFAKNWGVK